MKKLTLLLFAIICASSLYAQETCTEKLYNANRLYERGQLAEAIEVANGCLDESNSITDRWQAYHLLALAHLANLQRFEARQAAEKMLELNPTYNPGLKDSKELVALLQSIPVIPKFSMGLAATVGGNMTYPAIESSHNPANYEKSYTSKSSWQLGLIAGYNMNEIISLQSGFITSSKKFGINYTLENKDVNIDENLTYIDIPLYARFSAFPKKELRFFGDVGIYFGQLISSRSSFALKSDITSFSSENINSESRRNKTEYGMLIGGGVSYRVKELNISLDLRYYQASFYNITNEDKRYDRSNLVYNYYFLDDDLKLNNLAISLSFIQTLNYKVLKVKG